MEENTHDGEIDEMEIMDIRFENADDLTVQMMNQVREEHFKALRPAVIKVLFDLKKRVTNQKLTLGRIMKANDLIRNLTERFSPRGCDYVLFLDKMAWGLASEEDKIRLMRHELRHGYYNPFAKNVWQLLPHDIEDFEAEIVLNRAEPGWAKRLAQITQAAYEQQADQAEQAKQQPAKAVVAGHIVPIPRRRAANG
jgi:hypothetical protein